MSHLLKGMESHSRQETREVMLHSSADELLILGEYVRVSPTVPLLLALAELLRGVVREH